MKTETPKWLQELQESSWELELLISGGAIFSLFQASDYVNDSILSLGNTITLTGGELSLFIASFGIQVLTLGFILHLLLRAFWLALVCINYVFPQGIRSEKVRWKKPFRPAVGEGEDLHQPIMRTNYLCGLVMYLSIISTFLVGGIMLVIIVLLNVPEILLRDYDSPLWDIYLVIILLSLTLYIIDLVTFGALRKVPVLAYAIFPLFRLFDYVSLRFLYQRSIWLFSTNISKLRFSLFSVLFLLAVLFVSYSSISRKFGIASLLDQRKYLDKMASYPAMYTGQYADESNGERKSNFSIPSRRISSPHLELFMLYIKRYDYFIDSHPHIKQVSDLAYVWIDDSLYQNLRWHPQMNKISDQRGIVTMIPIRHLDEGPHVVRLVNAADSSFFKSGIKPLEIPFWKENGL